MSAAYHIHPGQFPLFVPAKTIVHSWDHTDGGLTGKPDSYKLNEALSGSAHDTDVRPHGDEPSLYDSVKTEGIKEPVRGTALWQGSDQTGWKFDHKHAVITEGHHRVAAAYDQNEHAEIPVRWSEP